jgi:glycosyltransferase involved in cell wall biosynthesis
MRIAYLSVSDQLGGSEIVLLEIIKGVARLRPDWPLQLILPGRGPLLDLAEAAGADCVVAPMPASLARLGEFGAGPAALAARLVPVAAALPGYLHRLRSVVRACRPSILHTNGFKAHIAGARAAAGAHVVWHLHEYVGARRLTRTLLQRHERRVSAMIANSRSVADDVTAALRPAVPVRVVYNAVDLAAFAPEGPVEDLDRRAGLAAPAGRVVRVGLVATFARWKGHEVFLRALAAVPADLPVRGYVIGDAVYDTAGSQHSMDELRALGATLGLAGRVGFTGFLPPAPAMRALDVMVHASTRPEPFGLVIAEAMACGRAVIASASGGAAELVEDGTDALTHAPGDAEGLSRCIGRLARDGGLRSALGTRARASARRQFDPDRLAREVVEVYEAAAR